jgi:DNA-binding CsgD family transcriptional regulator
MAQSDLDRAVHRATSSPGATAVARLAGSDGEWNHLLIIPVTGRASELFFAAAAIAVLIRRTKILTPLTLAPTALCEAFGLTDREAALATLIGKGLALHEVARSFGISIGTARNHLKAVFDKTHTKRQAELVELLGRLRP